MHGVTKTSVYNYVRRLYTKQKKFGAKNALPFGHW